MTRPRKQSKPNQDVARLLATNYDLIKSCLKAEASIALCSWSFEDIFQDTCLHIICDEAAVSKTTLNAFIEHFRYRYNMIKFRTIQDNAQLKKMLYADYLQAKKENE